VVSADRSVSLPTRAGLFNDRLLLGMKGIMSDPSCTFCGPG
jgi:hypothetical protein